MGENQTFLTTQVDRDVNCSESMARKSNLAAYNASIANRSQCDTTMKLEFIYLAGALVFFDCANYQLARSSHYSVR